jgi:ketoreductase RED2
MGELDGRVALVTGSSSGIGEATARRLAGLGANVVVNSSSSVEAGEGVAASLPSKSVYIQGDIANAASRENLLAATIEQFGRLDILVNNAGWTTVVPHDDIDALTDEIFRKTFEVNVFGTWGLTKSALPHLRQSPDGNVIFVTSEAGVRPTGSSMAYSMTKTALNKMAQLLAKSYGPIRFNAVAPGLVTTPWTSDWDDVRTQVTAITPLHRLATPDDIAEGVLAFVRNSYVTGSILVVDGGLSQAH